MPNYYELIELVPTATTPEIENAIDARYNQWRALVTHHDPNVVNQANQAIQLLEKIRGILTDPAKRNDYDEAIGIKGVTAGLADPTALLTVPVLPMTPPAPNPTHGAVGGAGVVNAWVCPKCAVANGIGTRFCKNCGTALGRECPNCGKTIEAAARFCPDCGVDVAKATLAKQIAEQEKRRAEEERRRLEELDVSWHYRTRQSAEQEPASYAQVWLLQIESPFEQTMEAIVKALNSDLAGYRFRTAFEPNLQGVIRTYDKSGANSSDPLQLQVYVEAKEGSRRRVLVRLFSNKFFGDKTKNRFEEALLANLRGAVSILDVTRM